MSQIGSKQKLAKVYAKNIGGIRETRVEFTPGVTALTGRNATNRTSLLQAIMAALGSDNVSLKGDANEGEVKLQLGEEIYSRTLTRTNGSVVTSGTPYLDESKLADQFAFLLEFNEMRRAVVRGDDLRELIMRPIDTEAIKDQINEFENEKRQLDDEIDELDTLKSDLPKLEQRRNSLEEQIEDKREELQQKEEELERADTDIQQTREEKAELEAKLDELHETRSKLENVRFELETERESLESLREERSQLETEQESLPTTPTGELEDTNAEIDQLRARKQSMDATVNQLRNIIRFNENLLEDDRPDFFEQQQDRSNESNGSITDQLLSDSSTVTCWTCGSHVEQDEISGTVEKLRDVQQEILDDRRTVTDRLEGLKERRQTLEEKQQRREQVQRRLKSIKAEIDDREANVADLVDQREILEEEADQFESAVDDLEQVEYSEIIDLHKEANQLEFDLGQLESSLDTVEQEIESIENQLNQRNQLKKQREEVESELTRLRNRIDEIEQQAVESFNEHMQNVLTILDYENIERIWIERTQKETREGRHKVTKSAFDLHVVRTTETGSTYEDTIDHLSESEREVTGLVFALAGYLVHEMHEKIPFMLLDSLEALDSQRISALIDYFSEYVDYLVVALLPEDAAALDKKYQRVTTTRE